MKKLHLSYTQRLKINSFLSTRKGDVGFIRECSKLMDEFELNQEEKKRINLRPVPQGIAWEDSPDYQKKEVELEREQAKLLLAMLAEHGEWAPDDLKWLEPTLEELS
jgi:hypothetical protein